MKENNKDLVGGTIFNIFNLDTIYSFLWALKKPIRFFYIMFNKEIPSIYNGKFKITEKEIILIKDQRYKKYTDKNIYDTDIVSNFFVAKTKKIKSINGWQPEHIKVGEHQAFFLRLKKNNINVGYSPKFGVKHYPKKTIMYSKYRMRSFKMMKESLKDLDINSYKAKDTKGNLLFSYKKDGE